MSDAAPKSGTKRSRGEFERSVDAMAANIVSKAQETLCAASSSTTMRIARVAYAHTPLLISPPEIHHSPAHNIIFITTRSGINVYTDDSLDAIEKGYAEGVDNTPLVSARLAAGGSVLLALPHPKSGHMAGGVYFFRRGFAGDIRLKPGPGVAGGIVYFDVHPANGTIIGITNRGTVFQLSAPFRSRWAGPMFPVGFQLMTHNEEYAEAEEELDLVDESGNFTFLQPKTVDVNEPVDVISGAVLPHTTPSDSEHAVLRHLDVAALTHLSSCIALLAPFDTIPPVTAFVPDWGSRTAASVSLQDDEDPPPEMVGIDTTDCVAFTVDVEPSPAPCFSISEEDDADAHSADFIEPAVWQEFCTGFNALKYSMADVESGAILERLNVRRKTETKEREDSSDSHVLEPDDTLDLSLHGSLVLSARPLTSFSIRFEDTETLLEKIQLEFFTQLYAHELQISRTLDTITTASELPVISDTAKEAANKHVNAKLATLHNNAHRVQDALHKRSIEAQSRGGGRGFAERTVGESAVPTSSNTAAPH